MFSIRSRRELLLLLQVVWEADREDGKEEEERDEDEASMLMIRW